jgi:hypothetical protein
MAWTRITDPEQITELLPAWFARRMIGLRGSFGLLLTTGDVLRLTSIAAAHRSSDGTILLDVLLDHAGVPDGVDLAWRAKHFLGAPVPGATLASVHLSHIVTAVEFTVAELAEDPSGTVVALPDDMKPEETDAGTVAAVGTAES